jgi:hypothetical protein
MLDMTSCETAALAATLPSVLPPFPPEALKQVGEETCVWLNAVLGRIYRDAARSPHFHAWLGARVAESLNKGWKDRPDFIDDFAVMRELELLLVVVSCVCVL